MADVINETAEDVVYELDDGGGPGGENLRNRVRGTREKKYPEGIRCVGYLASKTVAGGSNRVYGAEPEHGNSNLVVSFWRHDIDEPLTLPKKDVPRSAKIKWTYSGIIVQ